MFRLPIWESQCYISTKKMANIIAHYIGIIFTLYQNLKVMKVLFYQNIHHMSIAKVVMSGYQSGTNKQVGSYLLSLTCHEEGSTFTVKHI